MNRTNKCTDFLVTTTFCNELHSKVWWYKQHLDKGQWWCCCQHYHSN